MSPRFVSTRGVAPASSLSDALAAGLAPDGGLYIPEVLPALSVQDFDGATSLAEVAERLLRPFFASDRLASELAAICAEAFDFDAPLVPLRGAADTWLLELFHGPTAAFKDYGARFLAACLRRLHHGPRPLTILVATSGDTGAAVAGAFHGLPGLRVVILYPDGRVSPRQAHQLGAFGGNVRAFKVAGNFDDCQALAKRALNDAALQRDVPLSSANSISLGRLLPQMAYYAHAALGHHRTKGGLLDFVVPTGNLGNALAAVLARACGLPIGQVGLATNANRTLADFFAGGAYVPRASIATLANAMDVGAPSNFERLRWLAGEDETLRSGFTVTRVDDDTIRRTIVRAWQDHGVAVCPHTATALHARSLLGPGAWAVVATAHPAKFESIVEPLLGVQVEPPAALAGLLAKPSCAMPMANDYAMLESELRAGG